MSEKMGRSCFSYLIEVLLLRGRGLTLAALLAFALSTPPSAAATTQSYWTTVKTLDDYYAHVVDVSDDAQRILYQSDGAYRVFDRSTGSDRRVDIFFDGTALPDDVLEAAISGDGSTVVLLRNPGGSGEPTLRIVRLDQGENFEVTLPDPGQQTWSSGWVEQCSVLTRLGALHLDDDGNVAWLTTSPCYYDKVLALDISSSTLHWRFISALRGNTSEVSADGSTFALGGDFYYDYNGNEQVDPGEPTFTWLFLFPVEFIDNDAEPGNIILDWPSAYPTCEFPSGARSRVDAAANRIVVSVDEAGLDPDTVVYPPGRQLYWASTHDCRMHSLGATTATKLSQLRISIDGRSVLQETADGGASRIELSTGSTSSFAGLPVGAADPLLVEAAATKPESDPGTGEMLGSLLQVAQLSGTPSALKVAIVGDSYISGEGAFGYMSGTDVHEPEEARNLCHRSVSSWAYQLGQRLAAFRLNSAHPQLKSFACAGATTESLETGQFTEPAGQIDQLKSYDEEGGRPVDVVFASIGGNDAGFKSIVQTCLFLNCLSPEWEQERLTAAEEAASDVEAVLEKIKKAAPHATVFLTGYPSIVDPPTGDCADLGLTEAEQALIGYSIYGDLLVQAAGGVRVDRHEQAWLTGTLVPALNRELSKAATEAGVRWIDPSGWFAGHDVCSDDPYGNGIAAGDDFPSFKPLFGNESFHPNPDGYAEMEKRIEFAFGADFRPDDNPTPIPQGIHHDQPAKPIAAMVVNGQMQAWGDSGKVTIQGLPDGSRVALGMYSDPTLLSSGTVGPDGEIELPYQIPAGLYPGLHILVAYDEESGEPLTTTITAISPPEECLDREGEVDRDRDDLADRCDASFTDGPVADGDGDGIENLADDCPWEPDPDQLDINENGVGDACDAALGYNAVSELEPFPVVSLPRPGPKVTVLSQPPFYTSSSSAQIAFSTESEDPSAIELTTTCSIDGEELGDCSSPLDLTNLQDGYHHVEISAEDSNGSTSASIYWSVDTLPPEISVTVPSPQQHFPYGSAATPALDCDVNDSPLSSCVWSALDTYSPGARIFAATATDPAGNVGHAEVPYFVDAPPDEGEVGEGPDDGGAVAGRAIVSRIARRRGGAAVSLRCPVGSTGCPGVIARLIVPALRHRGKAWTGRPVLLDHSSIDLRSGQIALLTLRFDRAKRSLCRKRGNPRARVLVEENSVKLAAKVIRPCAGWR